MKRKRPESQVSFGSTRQYSASIYEGTDPTSLSFQEWTDQSVNLEKWESNQEGGGEFYEDSQNVILPPSIIGYEWKRPSQIFTNGTFVIYEDKPDYPDLIAGSQHLLDSEFIRNFIGTVDILCYVGNSGKFSMEYTSTSFLPTVEDQPWKPWHHIYSKCGAGKGQKHLPIVNDAGKYLVRLFWMGTWRKVYVDDLLPLNTTNQLMLPSLPFSERVFMSPQIESPKSLKSEKEGSAKISPKKKKKPTNDGGIIQLWPYILAKAIMKVASLSWSEEDELKGFDMIHCLTGWIPYKMYTRGLSTQEIWDICVMNTQKYRWPEDQKTKRGSKSPRPKTAEKGSTVEEECYMLMCHTDEKSESTEKTSRRSVFVAQARDVPLTKPSKLSDFPTWKRGRWLEWAIKSEMVSPLESDIPIKSLLIVDPFRAIDENLSSPAPGVDYISTVSEGALQSRKASREERPRTKSRKSVIPDIAKWREYEQLSDHIKYFTFYYKPSKYKVITRISNIKCENIDKESKFSIVKPLDDTLPSKWREILRPATLKNHRNEPIYFFRDSTTSLTILMSLTHTGYEPILLKDKTESNGGVDSSDSECGLCTSALLQRVINNTQKKEGKERTRKIVEVVPYSDHPRPEASLVITQFQWRSECVDDMVASFKTFGSSSYQLKLSPGRRLLCMWLKTDTSFVIQFLADDTYCVGSLEEIYPLMALESDFFQETVDAVVKSFETLTKSFGKPDFQENLKAYYNSYKPTGKFDKYELKTIHETFFEELCRMMRFHFGPEDVRALNTLFRIWEYSTEVKSSGTLLSSLCYPLHEEEKEYVKLMEKSAIGIQSFFRGCYERALLKRHLPTNRHFKGIAERLKNITTHLFSKNALNLVYHIKKSQVHWDQGILQAHYLLSICLEMFLVKID
ncbi:hypothetical protein JTB14_010777 [Gonioctena quinquepunctata]|nr:hypothetical protein JTB14_010777 [Gonioctena quinquepunctata]